MQAKSLERESARTMALHDGTDRQHGKGVACLWLPQRFPTRAVRAETREPLPSPLLRTAWLPTRMPPPPAPRPTPPSPLPEVERCSRNFCT